MTHQNQEHLNDDQHNFSALLYAFHGNLWNKHQNSLTNVRFVITKNSLSLNIINLKVVNKLFKN